eukprot:GEMP01040941.1.p2 GENE.GEMP01040941.1~~GEMP01040941.1.p2  ORF type:complete len:124 (+),score=11.16 GEMP01040941.1:587-958(+)
MIQANKGFTLSKFHQKGLDIRKHELEYFSMVFDRMSSVSGMLATFASSAMMLRVPRWKNPVPLWVCTLSSFLCQRYARCGDLVKRYEATMVVMFTVQSRSLKTCSRARCGISLLDSSAISFRP